MDIHSHQDDKGCLLFTYTCVSILFDLSMQPSENVSIHSIEVYPGLKSFVSLSRHTGVTVIHFLV